MFTSHFENLLFKIKGIFLQDGIKYFHKKMYLRNGERYIDKNKLWLICDLSYFIRQSKKLILWQLKNWGDY